MKDNLSRAGYLQYLCNKYGDFKVAYAYKVGDKIVWSKHRSVLDCWHSDEGIIFLERANNRSILSCEIVFDIDHDTSLERAETICRDLQKKYGLGSKLYHSGSKGYHIHVIHEDLTLYQPRDREKIRQFLLKEYDCDLLKKSEHTMMALEYVPHWRTGKEKTLIAEY